ncbi:membrane protein insertase YidC [Corynebacterium lizhenjunii]|uniref:Membrane protein insertase YidC n=1 Tax=Corynebacterium lizhenjunii TaxID=2709394 RepID=A0A7T0P9P8_9CORY|nr:membrane protein insertase YidC [Corynebacterium lizhenjunii]QPK79048.1 membrane protein insertase YidC [Corynebacterium lizhenjunii]
MIDIFVYPVSAIMKLWHMILHSFLGDQLAWLVSIPLLVLTVRGLMIPLTFSSVRSARLAALMRPEVLAHEATLKEVQTPQELHAYDAALKEIHTRYRYRPALGCLIPVIMVPVFLGLYQVILRMAKPEFSGSIGVLNPAEVEAFRATTINGIPLPAFVSMPQDWATQMGVDSETVRHFITPLLVAAIVATVLNMCISTYRSALTTQYDQAINRRVLYFMAVITAFVPYMLWNVAMAGPVPVAVILYWFTTNSFTLAQTIITEVILRTRYPLSEEAHELRRESWRKHRNRPKRKVRRAEKKAKKVETKQERARINALRKQLRQELKKHRAAQKEAGDNKPAVEPDPTDEPAAAPAVKPEPTDKPAVEQQRD